MGSRRLARGQAKELTLHYASERERGGDSGDDADSDEHENLAHDQPDDVAARGAEGDANADLASALGNCIGHDAVEANYGEQSSEETEDSGKTGDHALGGEGVVDLDFGGTHGEDRKIRIH